MIWWLYNTLFSIGFLLLLPRFLLRMLRRGGYARHFLQRFGHYDPALRTALAQSERVWIHAVSVGELTVAFSLVERWRARQPGRRFLLSTTTSTGYAFAAARLAPEDCLIYFPLDFPWILARVFRQLSLRALVLVECELWPNLIRQAVRHGKPMVLVNGRISEHSYRGYRHLTVFTRRVLPLVDLLCVQSAADGERLAALGAAAGRIWVAGSAKYDLRPVSGTLSEQARTLWCAAGFTPAQVVLLGGSTWRGEESLLLDLYSRLRGRYPALRLALAPRHAERTPEILREIEQRGLRCVQRSRLTAEGVLANGAADVFLIDSTGELQAFYAQADLVFVGKSLTCKGGQNVVEPAACGKPVLTGPHLENFPVIAADFRRAGAFEQVDDAAGLERAVQGLLESEERRRDLGRRAAALVRERAGAIDRTLDRILPLVAGEAPP